MQRLLWTAPLFVFVSASSALAAPDAAPPPASPPPVQTTEVTVTTVNEPLPPSRGFAQLYGNWGVNLGQTEYVPNGPPGDFKHPFAQGFGAGVTLGYNVWADWLSVILDYRFGHTATREGSITGVLTSAEGRLNFNEVTAGVRLQHQAGTGQLYAQFAAGVIFPFQTTRAIVYAEPVAQIGLVGEGSETEKFGWGPGGQAEIGYTHDLWMKAPVYIGAGIRVAAFQATNNGRNTDFNNFVTNFSVPQPMPITATIHHTNTSSLEDAAVQMPTTYSVQDFRINISIGARF